MTPAPLPVPPVSGRVVMFSPDPETGFSYLGLTSGELVSVPPGTPAAVILAPVPLLILHPRTPAARALKLPAPLAQILAQSFPLAQAIREGAGAKHDA